MEEGPSAKTDKGGLNQKRERRVSQREIAIRRLPREMRKAVSRCSSYPKGREMRILPQDHGCAG